MYCTPDQSLLHTFPDGGCGSMVECGLPKAETRVRFPSPAPIFRRPSARCPFFPPKSRIATAPRMTRSGSISCPDKAVAAIGASKNSFSSQPLSSAWWFPPSWPSSCISCIARHADILLTQTNRLVFRNLTASLSPLSFTFNSGICDRLRNYNVIKGATNLQPIARAAAFNSSIRRLTSASSLSDTSPATGKPNAAFTLPSATAT